MPQEVIVSVGAAGVLERIIAQIWMAPTISHLLEQPVRRAAAKPGSAIGVECRLDMLVVYLSGDARIRRKVPGFVEPDVRRMTTLLTPVEIKAQHAHIILVAECGVRAGIGGAVLSDVEHRPGYRRLSGQMQHLGAGSAAFGMAMGLLVLESDGNRAWAAGSVARRIPLKRPARQTRAATDQDPGRASPGLAGSTVL
jgi:hypothetical protein